MRRTILLVTAAVALSVGSQATALVPDTIVDRNNEAVGSVVFQESGQFLVEGMNYDREAEINRVSSTRFNFSVQGKFIGYAKRSTATRWDVFSNKHSERIGYVQRSANKRLWRAYTERSEDAVGEAKGPHPIQGAASALLIFHH
jgi:hypothetical protein